jgi:uncharacterized membrane protein (Fun14 family)
MTWSIWHTLPPMAVLVIGIAIGWILRAITRRLGSLIGLAIILGLIWITGWLFPSVPWASWVHTASPAFLRLTPHAQATLRHALPAWIRHHLTAPLPSHLIQTQ